MELDDDALQARLDDADQAVVAAAYAWRDMLNPKSSQAAIGLLDASRRLEAALKARDAAYEAVSKKGNK